MKQEIKPYHQLNNMDIGEVYEQKRNLYEIGEIFLKLEDTIPKFFNMETHNILNTIAMIHENPEICCKKNLYKALLELLLIEHHVQDDYRYCPDCLMKHQVALKLHCQNKANNVEPYKKVFENILGYALNYPNNLQPLIDNIIQKTFLVQGPNQEITQDVLTALALTEEANTLPGTEEENQLIRKAKNTILNSPHKLRPIRKKMFTYLREKTKELHDQQKQIENNSHL